MVTLVNRAQMTTATTGTGTITLGSAVAGYQTFAAAGVSDADVVRYTIEDGVNWEIGEGTYTASGTTLSRTPSESSSSGSPIALSGTAIVYVTVGGQDLQYAPGMDQGVATTDSPSFVAVSLDADPTTNLQAATKQYVDTIAAAGIHYHDPVRVETPSALTVTYDNGTAGVGATLTNAGAQAALVVDGVTLDVADRVLVYTQADATQNGAYTVTNVGSGSTNWVLTRASDADTYAPSSPSSLGQGDAFFVSEGDTGAGELYVCNTEGTITFGTTDITFVQVAATAVYAAGTGLDLSGTTFSIDSTVATLTGSQTLTNKTLTSPDINGGTIDGTVIGGTTPAAISGTTGQFGTSLNVDGTITSDGLTVNGDGTVSGQLAVEGKITAGDELDNTNLINTLDYSAAGGVAGYRPINLIDSLAGIKISRPNDEDNGAFIEFQEWDSTITTLKSRAMIVGESGDLFYRNLTTGGGDHIFQGEANAELMRIDSSGNVGIGTTSPVQQLHLAKAGIAGMRIEDLDAAGGYTDFEQNGSAFFIDAYDEDGTEGIVVFKTAGSETMRINSSGNVGIGTTLPAFALDVVGSGGFTRGVELGVSGVDATAYISQYRSTVETIIGPLTSRMVFGTVSNHDVAVVTNNTERMRIDSSGNVGIGTASPSTELHVAGDTTFGGAIDETVFALSGTSVALNPSNGTIQTHTLSGNTTYSDSLSAGEAITLMIDDGSARTITWPTMTWVNNAGAAPTLATSGYTTVALWKVSTTLYGALVGDGT